MASRNRPSSVYSTTSQRSSRTSRSGGGGGGNRVNSSACVSCNRCSKPLATTLYVCSCNCLFCEDCVYDHFQKSSECPSCGKMLSSEDFMELCIAEAPTNPTPEIRVAFQKVLTKGKHSTGSPYLTYMDACLKTLEFQECSRKATQFMMQQLIANNNKNGRSSTEDQAKMDRLKTELTQAHQSASTQRLESEQVIAELDSRYKSAQQKLAESYTENKELLEQCEFFRQQLAAQGLTGRQRAASVGAGSVSSNRSQGSGFDRSHENGSNGHNRPPFPNQGLEQPSPAFPPRGGGNNHHINNHGGGGRGMRGAPDPTPIRIAPSFESSRATTATSRHRETSTTGARYAFSGRNHSSSSHGGGGGPVRRFQQMSSRPLTGFGRSSNGSGGGSGLLLGGGRRR